MTTCRIEATQLYGRAAIVRKMLRPLVRGDSTCRRSNDRDQQGRANVILASFSGSEPPTDAVRDWRFSTTAPNLWGSYIERWIPDDSTARYFFLERAYLHLYKRSGFHEGDETEILALHCDPNEPPEPPNHKGPRHSRYKRGPHIHVSTAEQILMPHAHFALNLGQTQTSLTTFDTLSSAISSAIKMLDDQVIALYRVEGSSG